MRIRILTDKWLSNHLSKWHPMLEELNREEITLTMR